MSARRIRWPVLRDAACFVVGLGGIVYQQVTRNVSADLLLTYLTLITAPGGFALYQLRRVGRPEPTDTTESSSASPARPSLPPSS